MKKVLILLLVLPLTCICVAQSAQPNELHFNRLSIKNGLPEDLITASLQDKEGYVWIGTQAGLVRYDGYTTRVYKFGLDDANRSGITSIYEDRSGELWAGTAYEGLYHYNRAADTFVNCMHNYKEANTVGKVGIYSITDDRNGNLWIIMTDYPYTNEYVNLFDTKKQQFKHFGILEKGHQYINAPHYTNIIEDKKGRIWLGTHNGLYEYKPAGNTFIPHFASADSLQRKRITVVEDPAHPGIIWMNVSDTAMQKGEGLWRYNTMDNTVKIYRHNPNQPTSLGNDFVYIMQKDSKGRLWFGTSNGLSLFEPSSESFINYTPQDKKTSSFDNKILLLKENKAGNFWCFGGNGLLFFDAKTRTFKRYTANEKDPGALPYNYINNLLIDRSGTLWVGTLFQGLYWLNPNRSKFIVYKNSPGQPHYFPGGAGTSFAEDKDGTFWVWSSNGLYHWYPSSDSFAFIKPLKDQGEDFTFHFSATLIDKRGIVWCSSVGKGLFSYNPKTREIKNFKNNKNDSTTLSNDYVSAVYEDDEATLWVGTLGGGLCRFNQQTNTFRRYPFIINYSNTPNNNALDDNTVFSIYEDKQGTLWVGTNNGGLNRFNRETGTFTSYQNQLPGFITISNIFEDSKGHLWAGTHAGGLFLFNRKTNTAKKFTEKDGLLYDGVLGINEDDANNLWITSARGISVLNIQTNKISPFGTINGLPDEPENNLNFFKTSKGRFLMPSNNGFISFDPDQLKPDTILPVSHIESVEIIKAPISGNKQTDSIIYRYGKNKINLRYDENRLTFNYVGLQYQNSALNQYAYKLDRFDKDWVQAGTQRKVTYNNLSPGSYVFQVKAANSSGVWSTNDDSITIVISPPWWLTWWAYCSWVLIAGALVYILYRNRINQLKKKQASQINVMVAAQEGERKRISRDLHDDVGTKLSALKLFLSSLSEKAVDTNNREIKSMAESSEQFITEAMQDVRRLLLNLSPAVLEEFGYATAVEGLINKINQTKQIHFNLVMFGMKHRLQKEYELALYRITQELINNVLKHADAKNVSLQIGQRDKKIILMIEDDGKGFNVTANKDGYGLQNLAARTKLMQGTMTIDSQPGKGTSVWIETPDNFNV